MIKRAFAQLRNRQKLNSSTVAYPSDNIITAIRYKIKILYMEIFTLILTRRGDRMRIFFTLNRPYIDISSITKYSIIYYMVNFDDLSSFWSGRAIFPFSQPVAVQSARNSTEGNAYLIFHASHGARVINLKIARFTFSRNISLKT